MVLHRPVGLTSSFLRLGQGGTAQTGQHALGELGRVHVLGLFAVPGQLLEPPASVGCRPLGRAARSLGSEAQDGPASPRETFVVLARPAGARHGIGTKYRIPIAGQREFLRWFQHTKSA
jgi:hypothetical protein